MTTKCHQCGMFCSPTEFHPFAACLMFMGCHDSDKVRANLAALTATQATKAGEFDEHAWKWESEAGFTGLTDEQCNDLARQHTVFNGSHAMTNYVSLINAVIDLCTRDEAPLRSAPASGAVGEASTAALIELVALKRMKDRLKQLHAMGHGTDYTQYHQRQPLAWAAAFRVVEALNASKHDGADTQVATQVGGADAGGSREGDRSGANFGDEHRGTAAGSLGHSGYSLGDGVRLPDAAALREAIDLEPVPERLDKFASGQLSATPPQASEGALPELPATLMHDAGAYTQCHYCKRYSLDPRTLADRAPMCDCGNEHGWSGSFKVPGPDAQWSGKAPAIPPLLPSAYVRATQLVQSFHKDEAERNGDPDFVPPLPADWIVSAIIEAERRTLAAASRDAVPEGWKQLSVKPLTDDDIEAIASSVPALSKTGEPTWEHAIARAIERAHGISVARPGAQVADHG